MKSMIVWTICLSVLAAPCIYDVTSSEPAPLATVFATAGLAGST